MPTKPSTLLPSAGRLVDFRDGAVAGPLVLLGQAEVEGLVADGDAVLAEEDAEQAVEIAGDPGEERRHVGGAERDAGGADDLAARLLDLIHIRVARRLAPGIVGKRDVPLLAHLDQRGRERHRLGRRVVERPEGVAAALGGGQRRVEAHADHVDDLLLVEHRLAGEANVGQEAALVDVDLVLDHQLLGLAAPDVGLGLVVGDDQLDRPAVDAARLVDAVDRHLGADQRGLAAGGGGARQRLQGADLVRLGLSEGALPGRRHQHGGSQRARAAAPYPIKRRRVTLPRYQNSSSPIFLMVGHRGAPPFI